MKACFILPIFRRNFTSQGSIKYLYWSLSVKMGRLVETVPEGRYPAASGWGSSFAATFHPGWRTGHSAPSPQHSSLSCTYLWQLGTSAESQTPDTGPAASECTPHLRKWGMQPRQRGALKFWNVEMFCSPHCILLSPLTHSEAIVCESGSSFVLLV